MTMEQNEYYSFLEGQFNETEVDEYSILILLHTPHVKILIKSINVY